MMPADSSAPLLLANGVKVEIQCVAGDISILGALRATGGEWEKPVARAMASLIQPRWTCLDVGANIGVTTLSMAALAPDGQVYAFEPDASNRRCLRLNVDALSTSNCLVCVEDIALWDGAGPVTIGGADQLAGCSFVSGGGMNVDVAGARLRSVVSPVAIAQTALDVRVADVEALTLDDWVIARDVHRIDLLKIDVEGAERRVLRGAKAALDKYRPLAIIEYNPACAKAYHGDGAEDLYNEIASSFDCVSVIECDGSASRVQSWSELQSRLAVGRGWEDLLCAFD